MCPVFVDTLLGKKIQSKRPSFASKQPLAQQMRNSLKEICIVSEVPLALMIPFVSLPLLPFDPLVNIAVGSICCIIIIYRFFRWCLRNKDD